MFMLVVLIAMTAISLAFLGGSLFSAINRGAGLLLLACSGLVLATLNLIPSILP